MADKQEELIFIQQRIRQLRKIHNKVTAREVSLSLGWDETALSKVETGPSFPLFGTLLSICGYFKISLGEFFEPMLATGTGPYAKAHTLINELPPSKIEPIILTMEAMLSDDK